MLKKYGDLCTVIAVVAWIFGSATAAYLGVQALAVPGGSAPSAYAHENPSASAAQHEGGESPHNPPPFTWGWFIHDAAGFFTFILSVITVFLAIYTGLLWRLGRDEIISSHRPRLEVRFVRRFEPQDTRAAGEKPIGVSFVIVNTGEGLAHFRGGYAEVQFYKPDELPLPNSFVGHNIRVRTRFPVGTSDVFSVESSRWAGHLVQEMKLLRRLYLIGYLVYADGAQNSRTTHFCREYDSVRNRFVKVDDPDYESAY